MKSIVFLITLCCSLIPFKTAAQDYEFGKVSKEELAIKSHPIEPDAGAAVLYRSYSTSFDYQIEKGFVAVTEVHERIKIYNKDGYDWATQQVGLYDGGSGKETLNKFKGYTYNLVNGKIDKEKLTKDGIFEEERNKNVDVTKFTFPNIQDGSIIEYTYIERTPYISSLDPYQFQESIPVDKVEFEFRAPEYLMYRTHGKGWIPFNLQKSSRNRTLKYSYNAKVEGSSVVNATRREVSSIDLQENVDKSVVTNIPSIKEESFVPNLDNYTASLTYELMLTKFPNAPIKNYATTWEDVVANIYKSDGFGGELDDTRYFRDDIDEIVSEHPAEKDKMLAIFEFVKNKMAWNEYYGVYSDNGAKSAFKEGVGNVADINLMLTAMLKYAGLSANPVLISSKNNGVPLYPTRSGFNYVVSAVRIGETITLLDAADQLGAPNLLKPSLLNWYGYIVKENGTSRKIDLFPSRPATHNSLMTVSIDEDLMVSGKIQNRYSGYYARQERNKVDGPTDEDQDKYFNDAYQEIDILESDLKNFKSHAKPLSSSLTFEKEDGVEEIADKLYIDPLTFLKIDENYFKSETRDYPIDFVYPWLDRYTVTFNLPEGYVVDFIPEPINFNLKENLGSYKYAATQSGKSIKVQIERSINRSLIPAGYYEDLKTFFQYIVEKEAEKIVLKKA